MPRMGFEPAIRAFEQAKTVHTLNRAATVIGTVTKIRTLNSRYTLDRSLAGKRDTH
jgi:hypothetical protein